MRRKDREITDFSAMLDIVQHCDCCRLGMVDEQGAYILPLNFGWETDADGLILWFHGALEGKKIDLLQQNPAASFEMDTGHRLVPGPAAEEYTFAYRSVIGRGRVEFCRTDAEKHHGLACILGHYTARTGWEVPPAMLRATAVYCLRVESWTAKEHKVP